MTTWPSRNPAAKSVRAVQEAEPHALAAAWPDDDAAELKRLGVAAVFQPGASLDAIVSFIREAVAAG